MEQPISKYGYIFINSEAKKHNFLDLQKRITKELLKNGVPEINIRVDLAFSFDKIQNLPMLYKLINTELKKNDLLVVIKLNRCYRDSFEFLKLEEKLSEQCVNYLSFDFPDLDDDFYEYNYTYTY
jgi:DNA invertase Pin-like site-specific DNA recombinase